ncbi:ABC transporter permease [Sporosarcina trichiuri]|uniref:ABC transporter permease n=1 Tax=Sporosarcina trichiuri TaxID=3056445 RepID=UPI0025B3134B|nr:ABC transporter permease [Sporosarcina sp. 0.2-SM1T-5]WJY26098.1 ABC transporter permease [Sporosarcina sp. 0.2-SM1T-5]
MLTLAKRNMLLYFRDRSAVFFSLLSVAILIAVYVFFLGDLIADGMPEFPGRKGLLLTWVIAGIFAVTSITTTLAAFGTYVEDRQRRTLDDFLVTPLKRSVLTGGYLLSSLAIGLIMTFTALVAADIMLLAAGQPLLTAVQLLQSAGIIALSVLSAGSLFLLLVRFFRTSNACAAASTLIGTTIGFLAGIYIPIGSLPGYLQSVIQLVPVSHAALLFRQVLMAPYLTDAFAGAPAAKSEQFHEALGITFHLGDTALNPLFSVLYLIGSAALFFLVAGLVPKRLKRS